MVIVRRPVAWCVTVLIASGRETYLVKFVDKDTRLVEHGKIERSPVLEE